MFKKYISALLVIAAAVTMTAFPAFAAEDLSPEENNAAVVAQAKELEKKYGVNISYPLNSSGYATITRNNLETLDMAFSNLTPAMVRQVSSYYQKKNGAKIDINYVISDSGYNVSGGVLMAAFERLTSKIYVFLPKSAGRAITSGENPIALVHEFGHAFHLMCMDDYGKENMLAEWNKFNHGYRYNPNAGFFNPDNGVFISGYATTSFEEDVAETFAHVFARTAGGTGFKSQLSSNSQMTGLGQKVHYIENLMAKYLAEPQASIANYRRIYNTAATMNFEGIKFSGEHLQYIGYPQPKNILKGVLNSHRITSDKSTWVRALGAWRVIDIYGDMYFIFPGGTWCDVSAETAA